MKGPRGGSEIIKIEPGRLTIRREKSLTVWESTTIDPKATAAKLLKHMGGTTNRAEIALREIAFKEEV
jgi:hypothetical protein